jgi:hypothetical protein
MEIEQAMSPISIPPFLAASPWLSPTPGILRQSRQTLGRDFDSNSGRGGTEIASDASVYQVRHREHDIGAIVGNPPPFAAAPLPSCDMKNKCIRCDFRSTSPRIDIQTHPNV